MRFGRFFKEYSFYLTLYLSLLVISSYFQIMWREGQNQIGKKVESGDTEVSLEVAQLVSYFLVPRLLLSLCHLMMIRMVDRVASEELLEGSQLFFAIIKDSNLVGPDFLTAKSDFLRKLAKALPIFSDFIVGGLAILIRYPALLPSFFIILISSITIDHLFKKTNKRIRDEVNRNKEEYTALVNRMDIDREGILMRGEEERAEKLIVNACQKYLNSVKRSDFIALTHSFINFLALSGATIYTIYSLLSNRDTFRLLLSLFNYFLWPSMQFLQGITDINKEFFTLNIELLKRKQREERNEYCLDSNTAQSIADEFRHNNCSLIVENIKYETPQGKQVFNGFSCTFKPGVNYFITGNNGAGKSTLFRIICGILELKDGSVSIINDQNQQINCGYENRKAIVGPDKLIRVLPQVSTIPLGNNTQSGSVGEKQMEAIRQLLSEDAEFYLLDEPDAPLDSQHDAELAKLLNNPRRGSVIVISHNENLMSLCPQFRNVRIPPANLFTNALLPTKGFEHAPNF